MLESNSSPHLPLWWLILAHRETLPEQSNSVAFSYLQIEMPNIKGGKKSRNRNTGSIDCLEEVESPLKTLLTSAQTCKLLRG